MTMSRIHADWWQSDQGEQIHAVEIIDDDDRLVRLFYGYLVGAVRHCCEALSLDEAQQQLESMRAEP